MSENDSTRGQARFGSLLNDCRAIAVKHLNMLYSGIFESADSALLEFAAKAENNAMQAHFFEAVQEINRGRQNIQRAFDGEIKIGFAQFAKGRPLAVAGGPERTSETLRQPSTTGFDTSDLQLLDKLAHAESAVIQTLAAKTTHRYRGQLYALSQRLAIVNSGRKVDEIAVPAGPSHILYAFGASIRALRIEPNVKLILFALFDRVVMSQLEPLYEDLNRSLMKAGVLPNLRVSVRKRADSGADAAGRSGAEGAVSAGRKSSRQTNAPVTSHPARAGDDSGAEPSMGDQLFVTIRDLLAKHRRVEQLSTSVLSTNAKQAEMEAKSVEPYPDSTVLVSAINQLQVEHMEAAPVSDSALISGEKVDKGTLETIRLNLQAERKRIYDGTDRRRIPQVDIDVIDVVGMLFDCILNDETLPSVVKALLSRLHTPYLKIAVLDKNIFTSEQHPARRLLNTMVDAGGKWVSQDKLRAGIFPQMQYAVNRVLREFQEGLQLFDELVEEFTDAVEALKQKAALIELRAGEAAEGQEKLQIARARAHQELVARTAGQQMPMIAKKFLAEIWADHLMLILLRSRDGEHSQHWVEALRIADEIVWSVTPKHTMEEREQLAAQLPELQHTIEDELGSLGGYGKNEQEDLFGLLKGLQQQALQATDGDADDAVAATELRAYSSDAALAMESVFASGSAAVEPEVISADEQSIIDELRAVKLGALFDFRYSEAGNTRRLKLSWHSQDKSSYMFVDQAGVKAAMCSIRELASAVKTGNAHRVEERRKPFFEGALDAIRRILSGAGSE